MTEVPSDSIRIAYQWLAAQKRIKNPSKGWSRPLKHIIESWGGRYVSTDDVIAAAALLGLTGTYPRFNISTRFTRPALRRLAGIATASTMLSYRENYQDGDTYTRVEVERED